MSSAWESFHLSMYILAGPEPQRDRLVKAFKSHLARLSARDVPNEVRNEFAWLVREITRHPGGARECPVAATVERLQEKEVTLLIHSIIRIYDALARYQPITAPHERDASPD